MFLGEPIYKLQEQMEQSNRWWKLLVSVIVDDDYIGIRKTQDYRMVGGSITPVVDSFLLHAEIPCPAFFFPPNTWPCLLATANYLQGTCSRLGLRLTTAPQPTRLSSTW